VLVKEMGAEGDGLFEQRGKVAGHFKSWFSLAIPGIPHLDGIATTPYNKGT